MPPQPDELTLVIARVLEVDWQYVERVAAWDAERIAEVRSAGRKAGRLLGFKIATFQSQPDKEDRVAVIVAVRESPSEEDHQRSTYGRDASWVRLQPSLAIRVRCGYRQVSNHKSCLGSRPIESTCIFR